MKRKPRNTKLIAEINIAPFTDVILVLLIIFMVTTPLIYRSSIRVQLPQASNSTMDPPTKDIDVVINANGEVFMDQQKYSLKLDLGLFKFKLEKLTKARRDPAIVISGDRNVRYDNVVKVIDLASKSGIKHIVLATEFKR